MKTLLLTSGGMKVKEEVLKLILKKSEGTKVAYVITATKGEGGYNKDKDTDIKEIQELGFQVTYVDIEGKSEKELFEILNDKDVIYVQGGNTFYLLKFVKESGFDKVVKKLLEQGKIYIGVSAGSYICCPTIEMANWKRQDKNIVGLTDLTGMNLVPFLMSVHYKPEYRDLLKNVVANMKYSVKILTDDQAILIKGDIVKLVGKGKEIKL